MEIEINNFMVNNKLKKYIIKTDLVKTTLKTLTKTLLVFILTGRKYKYISIATTNYNYLFEILRAI